jgi:RNA 3'-phosphate cyclase
LIDIDGSQKSGSGTILRMSIALAAIKMQPLHIFNIRENRPQRGLKPQHLEAVLTAAKLCNAKLEGATLGSKELWFTPTKLEGGHFEAEIGTAGSIPMLLLTILPICAMSEKPVCVHIAKGGTDVRNSPTINYIRFVLLPTLKRIGFSASLGVHKYGYYPKGMGETTIATESCKKLEPLILESFGNITSIKGVSVCTFLADRKVAERQATAAQNYFEEKNLQTRIQVTNDTSNTIQKGSSITLWAETDSGTILGADAIGEIRKPSETVGKEAAQKLYAEIQSKSTIDVHLADMIIPYIAISKGKSQFLTRTISDHLETSMWLAQEILNTHFSVTKIGQLHKIEKCD